MDAEILRKKANAALVSSSKHKMKKIFRKLRASRDFSSEQAQIRRTQGTDAMSRDPAPRPDPVSAQRYEDPQQGVATFSGFDQWMSTFQPEADPYANASEISGHEVVGEVFTIDGMEQSPNASRRPQLIAVVYVRRRVPKRRLYLSRLE
jgi:hypothetical protein